MRKVPFLIHDLDNRVSHQGPQHRVTSKVIPRQFPSINNFWTSPFLPLPTRPIGPRLSQSPVQIHPPHPRAKLSPTHPSSSRILTLTLTPQTPSRQSPISPQPSPISPSTPPVSTSLNASLCPGSKIPQVPHRRGNVSVKNTHIHTERQQARFVVRLSVDEQKRD